MTSRHRRRIALVAVCALLAAFVPDRLAFGGPGGPPIFGGREDEAIGWLRAAAVASRYTSYAGTKTVTVWAQTVRGSEVRVYHDAPDRTRLEYLATGDQPARIVVISGGRQIEFVPGAGRYIEGPVSRTDEDALTRQILPQVAENYDVRFAGADRVAGRPVSSRSRANIPGGRASDCGSTRRRGSSCGWSATGPPGRCARHRRSSTCS